MSPKRLCWIVALVASLFHGCATRHSAGTSDYKPATGQLMQLPPTSSPQTMATITVKRDFGSAGSALGSILTIDESDIVELKPGEFIEFKIAEGQHQFGLRQGMTWGFIDGLRTSIAVQLEAGKFYVFRIWPKYGKGMQIQLTEH
jgi:hypothetical protein